MGENSKRRTDKRARTLLDLGENRVRDKGRRRAWGAVSQSSKGGRSGKGLIRANEWEKRGIFLRGSSSHGASKGIHGRGGAFWGSKTKKGKASSRFKSRVCLGGVLGGDLGAGRKEGGLTQLPGEQLPRRESPGFSIGYKVTLASDNSGTDFFG